MHYYITIHDQDILLDLEGRGVFNGPVPYTYLFVGQKPVDKVTTLPNLIVCRDFTPNFERYPHFYDFTGWYVLAANKLIQDEEVLFLQYDMTVAPELAGEVSQRLQTSPLVSLFGATKGMYQLGFQGMEEMMSTVDVTMDDIPEVWPTTQGTGWKTAQFYEFMEWFEPLFEILAPYQYCGHLAERALTAYCVKASVEVGYVVGLNGHESKDCHGTCDLLGGRVDSFEAKAQVFGKS